MEHGPLLSDLCSSCRRCSNLAGEFVYLSGQGTNMMIGVDGNPCGRVPDEFSLAALHNAIVPPAEVLSHIM